MQYRVSGSPSISDLNTPPWTGLELLSRSTSRCGTTAEEGRAW
ncbi:hypothetical protein E2C01_095488 [Portunus trituberculatus]|uniref:Uncharacterized protein n=1 Tax=Portunus trituberculatus TaxID=210409 RepID=A0A5B7JYZ8_PORTR|nr:hypothetical protein [Portunus trituberculatus]